MTAGDYYYTTGGSTNASDEIIWVQPYGQGDWNSDVYINGLPVNERLKRLEKMVMEFWSMLEPTTHNSKIVKMIEEIKELKVDLEENNLLVHEDEKEKEQPLDDTLFEI